AERKVARQQLRLRLAAPALCCKRLSLGREPTRFVDASEGNQLVRGEGTAVVVLAAVRLARKPKLLEGLAMLAEMHVRKPLQEAEDGVLVTYPCNPASSLLDLTADDQRMCDEAWESFAFGRGQQGRPVQDRVHRRRVVEDTPRLLEDALDSRAVASGGICTRCRDGIVIRFEPRACAPA